MSVALDIRHIAGIGKPVTAIGAGCWTIGGAATNRGTPIGWDGIDETEALRALYRAHDLGVRLYDTADVYGLGRSERLLGQLLHDIDRNSVALTSKVGYFAGTGAHPYQPRQMRHQLETTLDNLGTDHLDVYLFHSTDFGPADHYLHDAVAQMREFRRQGLVRGVGMRAPHEFAVEWAATTGDTWSCHAARFLRLFDTIGPDVLTVRHNLLSHQYAPGETDVFTFARAHGVGVLIKQALAQGVLLATHDPRQRRRFSSADHRSTDPLFTPAVLDAVHAAIRRLHGGHATTGDLARLALGFALHRRPDTALLVGFRDAAQIDANIAALADPPTAGEIAAARDLLGPVRDMLAARVNVPAMLGAAHTLSTTTA